MGFIRKVWEAVKRLVSKSEINRTSGREAAISDLMTKAIELWENMYLNVPPWAGGEASVVPMQIPASICAEFSRLILTEFGLSVSGTPTADFINEELKRELKSIDSIVERWAALGGMAIKPYVKGDDGTGKPTGIGLDVVPADRFFPLAFKDGEVTSAIFLSEIFREDYLYSRLEIHELKDGEYTIINKAYRSDKMFGGNTYRDRFREEIALGEVPEWGVLAPVVVLHDISRPFFVYIKTPIGNNVDMDSPLGVSVYARAVDAIRHADEQYGRALWEYRSKEAAVFADETLFARDKQGKPIIPTGEKRLYRTFAGSNEEKPILEPYSPEIRDESIFRGLNEYLMQIERLVGLAFGTLSHPQDVEKTATEIMSAKQRSYHTVSRMQTALGDGLRELVDGIAGLIHLYEMAPDGKVDVSVQFGDGVLEDADKEYQRRWGMVLAGKLKLESFYQWYFGVSEEEAKKMIPAGGGFPEEE